MAQLPIQVPLIDSRNMIDRRWSLALQQAFTSGGGTGNASILFGLDADRPAPVIDTFYLATDTGAIYFSNGLTWANFSSALTGDVTKPANSNVTSLADVFVGPGTYGNSTLTPVLTIDSKGRVTGLSFETITATAAGQGLNGALQFNNSGVISGANIFFNTGTGGLSFTNPSPTREALSPLTTKGDIFVRNATVSTRLPVGANTQVLSANSATATGLEWTDSGRLLIEFHQADATPFLIGTIKAGSVVNTVELTVLDSFDGTVPTVSVGTVSGLYSDFMESTDNDLSDNSVWIVLPGEKLAIDTDVYVKIVAAGGSTGYASLLITYST